MTTMKRSIWSSLLLIPCLCLIPLSSLGDSGFVLWVKGSSNFIKEAWHIHGNYDTLNTCNEARATAFKEALFSIENYKADHAPDMKLSINQDKTEYVTTELIGQVYNVTTLSFHCIRDSENP